MLTKHYSKSPTNPPDQNLLVHKLENPWNKT